MSKIHMNVPHGTPHIEIHRGGGDGGGCLILIAIAFVLLILCLFWDAIVAFFTWLFIVLFWLGVTALVIWGICWVVKLSIFYNANHKEGG